MKTKQMQHNNNFSNPQQSPQQLNEGLGYKDLEGIMKPTIHIDEFSSKMGEDSDVIVVSFFVRDRQAAKDLTSWFEKGYDFVLDADTSPGEIKPNRYLVYLEMRRRNAAPKQIEEILDDLGTLTEYESSDWVMVYKKKRHDWSPETFAELVPLTPNEYRERTEGDLNEMRVAAGITTKNIYQRDAGMRAIQAAAGIL
ncbi:hypothetical protein [Haliscomenobacter sp.]|uniref:hypothetical protein n=1 Tax=Haliscomenobacter sp. TaxID=2717303 RepID=UPI003364DF21